MGNKINILFTIPNFKTAGSQFVLLGLYKAMDRNLFKPYILVEKFPDLFPNDILENERLHLTEKVGERGYILKLASLLREKKIDILHSWDYKSNSIEALACKKAKVAYLYTKKNNAWSKRWFAKSFLATHVAYNNPDMQSRFFSSRWLKNKVTFIPHGVDLSIFKPQLSIQEHNKITIGCVGVVGPNKNQMFVLKALTKLPDNFQVFFFGKEDANYRSLLDRFVHDHQLSNRVFFKGTIDNHEIPNAMATFDMAILASKQEGLPLSIIEAMACGVPILSSNSGGGARYLLDGIQKDSIFGLDDPSHAVDLMIKLAKDKELRARMIAYGRQRVNESFTIEKEVSSYALLYQKLKS